MKYVVLKGGHCHSTKQSKTLYLDPSVSEHREIMDKICNQELLDETDGEADLFALLNLMEETHKVNTFSKVKSVPKMATRSVNQHM